MKVLKIAMLSIVTTMMLPFASCHEGNEVTAPSGTLDSVNDLVAADPDDVNAVTINQEIYDSLKSVKPVLVETETDLYGPMQKARTLFFQALVRGAFDDYPYPTPELSRASATPHTGYEPRRVLLPEDLHAKMFFKSKFGAQIVNKINALVAPEHRISAGTTYCCYWNVYYHKVLIGSDQMFGVKASPNCAFNPDSKESYEKRGYAKEQTDLDDGTSKIELTSYELVILYEDKSNPGTRLDIYYPRVIDSSTWKGYEFLYNIVDR